MTREEVDDVIAHLQDRQSVADGQTAEAMARAKTALRVLADTVDTAQAAVGQRDAQVAGLIVELDIARTPVMQPPSPAVIADVEAAPEPVVEAPVVAPPSLQMPDASAQGPA